MKKLLIPEKTFNLYKQGKRTFIHILKEDGQTEIVRKLKFGETLILVNKETREELEQIFWFFYDFKEIKRFMFLVFYCDQKKEIFSRRIYQAKIAFENSLNIGNRVFFTKRYAILLFHQALCHSALFFITDEFVSNGRVVMEGSFNGGSNEWKSDEFIVLEEPLKIKKDLDSEKVWKVCSIIPDVYFSI